ncbi:alpha/beta fold hydrolase [Mesorhizobium sp. IMUNJ 23232]|uniref:alpha/beta fold hydrolase n=1 Tax=Mesorhizobium sp. IMUNJ 23232 TaxID=3376064 RepID=UPI0037996719
MTATVQTFELGDFALDGGVRLPAAKLAYVTYGTLNAARDNVIVFPTWYVGTHADVEWLIGDGKPVDSARYFVIVPQMFGNGLSSSPSNTPAPYDRARFPAITIQDNVRAQHRLVTEKFGITRIQLVIGGSMGAFQAYQWGLAYPDLVERIAPCCGAARVSRHCYVFLEGPRSALLADPAYAGGDYTSPPVAGLKALGRVWAGWALSQEFYRDELYKRMGFDDVESFLVNFWEAFWLRCDANDLLSQLNTWQTADISKTHGYDGDLKKALGAIKAKAIMSPGAKDMYFPPEDMAWEVAQMPNAELRPIPGPWGHFSEVGIDPACNEFLGNSVRMLLAR